jgi:hypothetical protein
MRGSPCIPLVAACSRKGDWTPRLPQSWREFEQVIMVQYRTEYMVDGTGRLPSKMIPFNKRALVVKQKDDFSTKERSSEKTLIFVPGPIMKWSCRCQGSK